MCIILEIWSVWTSFICESKVVSLNVEFVIYNLYCMEEWDYVISSIRIIWKWSEIVWRVNRTFYNCFRIQPVTDWHVTTLRRYIYIYRTAAGLFVTIGGTDQVSFVLINLINCFIFIASRIAMYSMRIGK